MKVEVGLQFEITFSTQHLGLSIFYPILGSNNPALFRVLLFSLVFSKQCWVVLTHTWVKYGQTQMLG